MAWTQSAVFLTNFGTNQGWGASTPREVVDVDLNNWWGAGPPLTNFNPTRSGGDSDFAVDIVGFGAASVSVGLGGFWYNSTTITPTTPTGEGFRTFAPGEPNIDSAGSFDVINDLTVSQGFTLAHGVDLGEHSDSQFGNNGSPMAPARTVVWAQGPDGFRFYGDTGSEIVIDQNGHPHQLPSFDDGPRDFPNFGRAQGWNDTHNVQVSTITPGNPGSPNYFADGTPPTDQYASIVGFGNNGIVVARQAIGLIDDVTAQAAYTTGTSFGNSSGYNELRDIRSTQDYFGHELDLNQDGALDVVAFGPSGTSYAFGSFDTSGNWVVGPAVAANVNATATATDYGVAQGWTRGTTERYVADVNNDGFEDIVGFGAAGVYVSMGQPFILDTDIVTPGDQTQGPFGAMTLALNNFGSDQGWNTANHVRALGDVDGDADLDIVGFGQNATYVALWDGTGFTFDNSQTLNDLSVAQGWHKDEHVRTVADVDHDGTMDIVAMGANGTSVWNMTPTGP
jgi:hypothetical protein